MKIKKQKASAERPKLKIQSLLPTTVLTDRFKGSDKSPLNWQQSPCNTYSNKFILLLYLSLVNYNFNNIGSQPYIKATFSTI